MVLFVNDDGSDRSDAVFVCVKFPLPPIPPFPLIHKLRWHENVLVVLVVLVVVEMVGRLNRLDHDLCSGKCDGCWEHVLGILDNCCWLNRWKKQKKNEKINFLYMIMYYNESNWLVINRNDSKNEKRYLPIVSPFIETRCMKQMSTICRQNFVIAEIVSANCAICVHFIMIRRKYFLLRLKYSDKFIIRTNV